MIRATITIQVLVTDIKDRQDLKGAAVILAYNGIEGFKGKDRRAVLQTCKITAEEEIDMTSDLGRVDSWADDEEEEVF